MTAVDDTTELLQAWSRGGRRAGERLMERIYPDLKRLAGHLALRTQSNLTLQPSDLVQNLYLKLARERRVRWRNRGQFFAVAAQQIRRIMVDHARNRTRVKRGGGRRRVGLHEAPQVSPQPDLEILALSEALNMLSVVDPSAARLVELRYFGGLTLEEASASLDMSRATAARRWRFARSWLYRELRESPDSR